MTNKKKMVFRLISVLLTVIMLAGMAPVTVSAATYDEAMEWVIDQVEDFIEIDDHITHNGVQCSDFVTAYVNWLTCGDIYNLDNFTTYNGGQYWGQPYWDRPCPAGSKVIRWEKIHENQHQTPQPGDILCFAAGGQSKTGHVAIVERGITGEHANVIHEQGSTPGAGVHRDTIKNLYGDGFGSYQGIIRPIFGYPNDYNYKDDLSGVDEYGLPKGEAPSYVAWCLSSRIGYDIELTPENMSFYREAKYWPTIAHELRKVVNKTPAEGSVAYWEVGHNGAGSQGHVAYVVAANGSKWDILEYDWKYGTKSFGWRTIESTEPSGYIHFDKNDGTTATFTDNGQDMNITFDWNLGDFFQGFGYTSELAIAGLILSSQSEQGSNGSQVETALERLDLVGDGSQKPDTAITPFAVMKPSPDYIRHSYYGQSNVIANTVALRKYKRYDDEFNIITIVARGPEDASEPVFNGLDFEAITIDIVNIVRDFLSEEHGISISDPNNRFLVTGYGVGGACANLVGVRLLDNGAHETQVFTYTFASPYTVTVFHDRSQDNIYNIINSADPVTTWGSFFGFGARFGRDRSFSSHGDDIKSEYWDLTGRVLTSRHNSMSAYMAYLLLYEEVEATQDYPTRYITVHCPVDIEVYDQSGALVGAVVDNTVVTATDEHAQIYADGDSKSIYLTSADDYTVKFTGTDVGEMTYTVQDNVLNSDAVEVSGVKTFENVALSNGKTMISTLNGDAAAPDIQLFMLDDQGDPIAEIQTDGKVEPIEKPPEPVLYAVTVVDGTAAEDSYAAGETVTIVADPAPVGQRFAGWAITPHVEYIGGTDATSQTASFTMPAEDVTATALYEDLPPAEYAVNVQTDGNGTAAANMTSALAGEQITLSTTPNDGYVFAEWRVIEGDVTIAMDNSFTMPAADVTVMAAFEQIPPPVTTYTVNFNLNGGTRTGGGALVQTVVAGDAAVAPVASRDGYTFAGWDAAFDNVTADVTVNAVWTYNGDDTDAPGDTGDTDDPGDTDNPGDTEEPGDTDDTDDPNPGDTDDPNPGDPDDTDNPGDTDAPGDTGDTDDSGDTDNPGDTEEPGDTDDTDDPNPGDTDDQAPDDSGSNDSPGSGSNGSGGSGSVASASAASIPPIKATETSIPDASDIPAGPAEPDISLELPGVAPRPRAFDDVRGKHWAYEYIRELAKNGIIDGYPTLEGTYIYRPEHGISRAEFVKLVVASLALPLEADFDGSAFADWADVAEWARPHVGAAVKAGIIKGSQESGGLMINADTAVTRQEMIEMATRALNIETDGAETTAPRDIADYEIAAEWARTSLAFALDNGMINTDGGTVRPLDDATRAEAAMALYGMLAYARR